VASADKATLSASLFKGLQRLTDAKTVSEVTGTVDNHLNMTSQAMLETVGIALLINRYQTDEGSLLVTPTKAEDVLQFLV
ncbi:hypothetical protein ACQ0P6_03450, partial [Streptococcus canis]